SNDVPGLRVGAMLLDRELLIPFSINQHPPLLHEHAAKMPDGIKCVPAKIACHFLSLRLSNLRRRFLLATQTSSTPAKCRAGSPSAAAGTNREMLPSRPDHPRPR